MTQLPIDIRVPGTSSDYSSGADRPIRPPEGDVFQQHLSRARPESPADIEAPLTPDDGAVPADETHTADVSAHPDKDLNQPTDAAAVPTSSDDAEEQTEESADLQDVVEISDAVAAIVSDEKVSVETELAIAEGDGEPAEDETTDSPKNPKHAAETHVDKPAAVVEEGTATTFTDRNPENPPAEAEADLAVSQETGDTPDRPTSTAAVTNVRPDAKPAETAQVAARRERPQNNSTAADDSKTPAPIKNPSVAEPHAQAVAAPESEAAQVAPPAAPRISTRRTTEQAPLKEQPTQSTPNVNAAASSELTTDLSDESSTDDRKGASEPAHAIRRDTPATTERAAIDSRETPLETTPRNDAGRVAGRPQPSGDAPPSETSATRVRFVQRVAKAFEAAQQRGGEVRLRLSPPELGSVRLELSLQRGVLTARLETETPAARSMLLDNMPALRQRLADQEIRVARFDVDLMDSSNHDDRDHAAHDRESRNSHHRSGSSRDVPGSPPQPTVSPAAQPAVVAADELNVVI